MEARGIPEFKEERQISWRMGPSVLLLIPGEPDPAPAQKVPEPLDAGGWEGLPGKPSSYNISVPQVSHTCEQTLGCWTSKPLNLRKCSFSVVFTFYKMHNFADFFLFLNEALLRKECADSVFSVLICWLRITWAFVYSSGVE